MSTSNFNFTDRAQATVETTLQLAKDHSNAQGTYSCQNSAMTTDVMSPQVHPAHLASALLNEGAGESTAGKPQTSLLASVIQKAGGEPVRIVCILF